MILITSNKSLATGNKGQVALFVALIFQVLFLFFAMIVNVGLVVHHKINLQNSADMAAYYGAMKQAELLNSIAHINYQMRQSWKLMAWRYRVLGTAGDTHRHPYNALAKPPDFRTNMDREFSQSDDSTGNFTNPPFCITYNPFNESVVEPGENTCKETLSPFVQKQMIRLFQPPAIAAGFIGFAVATAALTRALKDSALDRCKLVGPYNYIIVGSFLLAYQLDQYTRRVTLTRIARSMSQNKDDFDDIDGESVKKGAEETFNRNLTYANKDGRDRTFEMYNSLAGCGNLPSDQEKSPIWLPEIRAFPAIFYMDLLSCGNRNTGGIDYAPKNFDLKVSNPDDPQNTVSMPDVYHRGILDDKPFIKERIRYIAQSLSLYNERYRFILGYEKNPWCQAYVGIKASTKPKIPFAPSDLTLTASAFAKPFGGKIGPWYYKRWDPGTPESTGSIDDRVDMQLSLRIKDVATLGSDPNIFGNPLRIANFSKYIGDNYGLTSWRYLGHHARTLYNLSPSSPWRSIASGTTTTDQKILATNDVNPAPRLEDWDLIAQPIEANKTKDILAWNNLEHKDSGMRQLEIQALAPDQFDLAYYSIDPNFYENYYKRLQAGLLRKQNLDDAFFRPDLGARIGDRSLEKFSVKDQIKTVKDISPPVMDFNTKLTYAVLNPFHLLTSWSNKSVFDYDKIDPDYFGHCVAPTATRGRYVDPQESPALQGGQSVPGECITGGRTGYSVKLISKDYLFAPVKVGGPASAESVILNPPSDF
ncbi:MAG: hypothetical protein JNL11_13070 [Bdellovibrionaceae bacterium]|nr:hypothetical protein [Pseudobdellovibrionaceae bacterium]